MAHVSELNSMTTEILEGQGTTPELRRLAPVLRDICSDLGHDVRERVINTVLGTTPDARDAKGWRNVRRILRQQRAAIETWIAQAVDALMEMHNNDVAPENRARVRSALCAGYARDSESMEAVGMVMYCNSTADELLQSPELLLLAGKIRLREAGGRMQELLALPGWSHVRSLDLRENRLTYNDCAALGRCEALAPLLELNLNGCFFADAMSGGYNEDTAICEALFGGPLRGLRRLDFANCGLQNADANALQGAAFDSLEALNVSGNEIQGDAAVDLAQHQGWPRLEYIDLRRNPLDAALADALMQGDSAVEDVEFDTLVTNEEFYPLALRRSPHLPGVRSIFCGATIDLSDAEIRSGVLTVLNAPRLDRVRELHLEAEGLDDAMILSIERCHQVEKLEIHSKHLTSACIPGLRRHMGPALASLEISDARLGDEGVIDLLEMRLSSLEDLTLKNCAIGAGGIPAILELPAVKKLSLQNNPLGANGAAAIAASTAYRRWQELNLDQCEIGNSGCAALLRASGRKALRVLSVDQNDISNLWALSDAKGFGQLESLSVCENPRLGNPGLRTIVGHIGKFKKLTSVSISNCNMTDGNALAALRQSRASLNISN